uniref:EF-hand domain-containing protein n=1 Tax=Heterosigma akashiwo TaxID=2829 RepID=A0A6S9GET2_HETAK|mmetsp:Transcript_15501/g.29096  ORF Transcript_15501/g.29096 Transcript_15501/m.29096 type:complete len:251 (+) Transcript_15501:247-999(+)
MTKDSKEKGGEWSRNAGEHKRSSLITIDDISGRAEFTDLAKGLEKMDRNHDGHIDSNEIVDYLDRYVTDIRKKKHLRIFAVGLTVICVVLAFSNFGLTAAAIMLARELQTSGSTLVDKDDNLIYTSVAYESTSGFTWGTSADNWIGLEAFTVTADDGALRRFVVSAVNASAPANVVQVVTAGGRVLRVDLAAQTLTDAESGAVLVSEAARRRRRLAEGGQRELCTGTCEEESGVDCGACDLVSGECDCGI